MHDALTVQFLAVAPGTSEQVGDKVGSSFLKIESEAPVHSRNQYFNSSLGVS